HGVRRRDAARRNTSRQEYRQQDSRQKPLHEVFPLSPMVSFYSIDERCIQNISDSVGKPPQIKKSGAAGGSSGTGFDCHDAFDRAITRMRPSSVTLSQVDSVMSWSPHSAGVLRG